MEVVQEAAHAVAAAELEVVEVVELWRGQEREVVAGVGDGGGDERHAVPGHSNLAIVRTRTLEHSDQVQEVRRWLPSTSGPSATGSRLETACSRGCEYRARQPHLASGDIKLNYRMEMYEVGPNK